MTTTTHRAGEVLEELLLCGALTPEDVASAVGRDPNADADVTVDGDVVTIESEA